MPELTWTPKAVADALEEAARTLRRLPPVKVRGYVSSWPVVIRESWETYGWDETKVRSGPPAPDAIDRMDEVLRWLLILEPDEVRLVWLRAEGVRWKNIAHRFSIDRSTAWRRWTCGLITIAARLNAQNVATPSQHQHVQHFGRDLVG